MIVEHARVSVKAGQAEAFEAAVGEARLKVLPSAPGFIAITLHRCIEEPGVYVCVLEWESLEAHTVTFREGPLFAQWRALVGPHFAEPPAVLHYEIVPAG